MLKPYWDRPSGKQYRLKANSYTELLKHTNSPPLGVIPEGLGTLPANLDLASDPPLSRNPLAPISVNSVWSQFRDIERYAGSILPLQSDAQPYTRYEATLSPPPNRYVWGGQTPSPSVSAWGDTRANQQHIREYSGSRQSLLIPPEAPAYSGASNVQQGDPKPEAEDTSWYTTPLYTLAIFGALILGYHFWSKDASTRS